MIDVETIRRRFELLSPFLDEKTRRLMAGAEADAIGFGGISIVSDTTGMSRDTVRRGVEELQGQAPHSGSIRRPGGGRKKTVESDPTLREDLEELLHPTERGDPESPLRWTSKSVRHLAGELQRMGHQTSHRMVAEMLHDLGYSLQANRKTLEGSSHPDRDAQFEHINRQAQEYLATADPVISVDTKKKELVGEFKNGGREWCPKGMAEKVKVHDFLEPELGRAIPYGVYDLASNSGWVSVGVDHDTAQFAAETLHRWWPEMGSQVYPEAEGLLITADSGGSNSSRSRLWKVSIQGLADLLGFPISVCHFPPGTSKWNKIEHRMFCHITQNWRGRPLTSREVVVNLIGNTRTKTGLEIHSELDEGAYQTAIKVTNAELAAVRLKKDPFHGEWNYTILPRK